MSEEDKAVELMNAGRDMVNAFQAFADEVAEAAEMLDGDDPALKRIANAFTDLGARLSEHVVDAEGEADGR